MHIRHLGCGLGSFALTEGSPATSHHDARTDSPNKKKKNKGKTSLPAASGMLESKRLDHKILAGSSSRRVRLLQQQPGSLPRRLSQLQTLQLVQ